MKKTFIALFASAALLPLLSAAANSQDSMHVTLKGEVEATFDDTFHLDLGNETVIVEMDTIDWFLEDPESVEGAYVEVTGTVKKDYFDERRIRATTVTIRDAAEKFYADPNAGSSELTEGLPDPSLNVSTVEIQGTVVEVGADSINLESNGSIYSVDTSALPGEPKDHIGNYRLTEGLRAKVEGIFRPGFFEQGRLVATSIIPIGIEND